MKQDKEYKKLLADYELLKKENEELATELEHSFNEAIMWEDSHNVLYEQYVVLRDYFLEKVESDSSEIDVLLETIAKKARGMNDEER